MAAGLFYGKFAGEIPEQRSPLSLFFTKIPDRRKDLRGALRLLLADFICAFLNELPNVSPHIINTLLSQLLPPNNFKVVIVMDIAKVLNFATKFVHFRTEGGDSEKIPNPPANTASLTHFLLLPRFMGAI
ncbi:protein of unknown function [Magnetospirillum gryphiswaldense MSR-1 v2]|uniref:Uncharacterized protein n=1 Tax=Magnetospirillum gryphiswaldense (strain DSM 6361 / JCM 21280 / NBRC 15271 / MSR-1) TaxID=431944 RepID=V6F3I7_MAGGM|nr:protein of unknown function [Magnetospirillum gryphiswaldense MSR-1 v2]